MSNTKLISLFGPATDLLGVALIVPGRKCSKMMFVVWIQSTDN